MNDLTTELVKNFEGFRLNAYPDTGGVWTIGYGSTHGVCEGMKIDQSTAERMLCRDLQETENCVIDAVKNPLNENQKAALVSLVYNIGTAEFRGSTLLRFLNMPNGAGFSRAADQFPRWNRVKGKVDKGLVKRRSQERALFLAAPDAKDA